MHLLKKLTFVLSFCLLVLGASSCVGFVVKDSSKQKKGWYMNSHNPHHPLTTNPGHTKGKKKH
jgi:ABC-type oligopeptide transport system substrate-binding subunit